MRFVVAVTVVCFIIFLLPFSQASSTHSNKTHDHSANNFNSSNSHEAQSNYHGAHKRTKQKKGHNNIVSPDDVDSEMNNDTKNNNTIELAISSSPNSSNNNTLDTANDSKAENGQNVSAESSSLTEPIKLNNISDITSKAITSTPTVTYNDSSNISNHTKLLQSNTSTTNISSNVTKQSQDLKVEDASTSIEPLSSRTMKNSPTSTPVKESVSVPLSQLPPVSVTSKESSTSKPNITLNGTQSIETDNNDNVSSNVVEVRNRTNAIDKTSQIATKETSIPANNSVADINPSTKVEIPSSSTTVTTTTSTVLSSTTTHQQENTSVKATAAPVKPSSTTLHEAKTSTSLKPSTSARNRIRPPPGSPPDIEVEPSVTPKVTTTSTKETPQDIDDISTDVQVAVDSVEASSELYSTVEATTELSTTEKNGDSRNVFQKVNDFGKNIVDTYGPGKTAGIVAVILFVFILLFCCLCRCRKRRKYSRLRKLQNYGQEKDFLLTNKSNGKYQSDRVTLLDESSEDEF